MWLSPKPPGLSGSEGKEEVEGLDKEGDEGDDVRGRPARSQGLGGDAI